METISNGGTSGVRNGSAGDNNENNSVLKEPSNDLIEIVVTEQVDANPPGAAGPLNKEVPLDPGVAPLAESEESDQSSIDLDKLAKNEENEANKKDEEATLPRLQLLPLPGREVSPNWGPSEEKSKLDLSNLKLHPSKTSLLSAMDKIKVPKPNFGTKSTEDTKLRFFVGFLFLSCSLLIGGAHVLYYQHLGEEKLFPHVTYETATRILRFETPDDKHLIELSLGVGLHPKNQPFDCKDHHGPEDESRKCLEWYNQARLTITHSTIKNTIQCYNMYWQSLSDIVSPTDCFATGSEYVQTIRHSDEVVPNGTVPLEEEIIKNGRPLKEQGHWYGGGESLQAAWPLQKGHIKLSPFVTGDEGQTEWGNAIRKYFVNSRGVSLKVADHTPLSVSVNDPQESGLCLQARFDDFAYYYHRFNLPRLNYTICMEKNVRKLHYELLPKSFWDGHKQRDLDTLHHLLKTPIWQVPPAETVSHEALERYVEKIVGTKKSGQEDYSNGYLLLDYHWQERMGDLKFKKNHFPNANETVKMVKDHGLKLVLTVSPFISTESENFASGVRNNIFVSQRKSSARVPALTWFKDVSSCGMLDMTSNNTAMWFRRQLRNLVKDLDVDVDPVTHHETEEESGEDRVETDSPVTFFLQTGNTFHTPSYFQFEVPLDNPDLFREHFVKHVMDEVPVIGVSGASSRRPKAPAFVFLSPLEPKWSHLRSIIPNVLQLSVIGYPFINPGAVGGVPSGNPEPSNGSIDETQQLQEELELYVRWWQLNTFLPMLHFVKPPSAFPAAAISGIAKSLKSIRTKVVLPELIRAANDAMHSSAPIIRPLWMINPLDPVTHTIDDQFLIGDRILVAPVLHPGVRERNVYLPMMEDDPDNTVVWKRGTDGTFCKGGQWLNGTKVDLHEVLYFVRQKSDSLPGLPVGGQKPEVLESDQIIPQTN